MCPALSSVLWECECKPWPFALTLWSLAGQPLWKAPVQESLGLGTIYRWVGFLGLHARQLSRGSLHPQCTFPIPEQKQEAVLRSLPCSSCCLWGPGVPAVWNPLALLEDYRNDRWFVFLCLTNGVHKWRKSEVLDLQVIQGFGDSSSHFFLNSSESGWVIYLKIWLWRIFCFYMTLVPMWDVSLTESVFPSERKRPISLILIPPNFRTDSFLST